MVTTTTTITDTNTPTTATATITITYQNSELLKLDKIEVGGKGES